MHADFFVVMNATHSSAKGLCADRQTFGLCHHQLESYHRWYARNDTLKPSVIDRVLDKLYSSLFSFPFSRSLSSSSRRFSSPNSTKKSDHTSPSGQHHKQSEFYSFHTDRSFSEAADKLLESNFYFFHEDHTSKKLPRSCRRNRTWLDKRQSTIIKLAVLTSPFKVKHQRRGRTHCSLFIVTQTSSCGLTPPSSL